MKRKPWAIIVLALLHILAPIGNLVLNAGWLNHNLIQHWNYWMNYMPRILFLSYFLLPIIGGFAILICRRWSYWVYLGCLGLIFISNLYSISTEFNIERLVTLIFASIIDLLAVAYFMVPAVKVVYMNPKMRWWESAQRYLYTHLIDINGNTGCGHVKNISEGGIFVTSNVELEEGQKVSLAWDFDNHDYAVNATVVFKGINENIHGYGMRFSHTSESSKLIKTLCAKLKVSGFSITTNTPGPEDSFANWIKNLLTTGKGLIPHSRNQR